MKEAARLAEAALSALRGAGCAPELSLEAQALLYVCRGRDVTAAMEVVEGMRGDVSPSGRKAWARSLLLVLSLALSPIHQGNAAALFSDPTAWASAAKGLQELSALARSVLPCCTADRGPRVLQLRAEAKQDICLAQALAGVAAVIEGADGDAAKLGSFDSPPPVEGDEWEHLGRCLAVASAKLLVAWGELTDNHRAHKLTVRPVCHGTRCESPMTDPPSRPCSFPPSLLQAILPRP